MNSDPKVQAGPEGLAQDYDSGDENPRGKTKTVHYFCVEKMVHFKTQDVSVFILTPSSEVWFTPQEDVLAVIDP